MKSKKRHIRDTLLITLTLLLSTLIIQKYPSAICLPANSMWIEPAVLSFNTTTTPVGFKFNVTIYTNLTVPSYAWQFYLTYNKNHLNVTGCWYSAGAKSEWAGPRPTVPQTPSPGTHNDTHNYILFGESLSGIVETPAGSYSLAIVQFQIIAAPPEGQTYQSQIRLDVEGAFSSYILDPDLDEIPLNFAGTTYSYESIPGPPTPLPNPWLEAIPSEYTAIRPEEFDIKVFVRDVDTRHKLVGAQFNITFNPDIIEPIELTPGTFMSSSTWAIHGTYPVWRFEKNKVVYGELILPNPDTGEWDLPQFPHGEGLMATITFKTIDHKAANFTIAINPVFEEFFLDANLEYIPYDPPKSCAFTYAPLPIPSLQVSPDHYISSYQGQAFTINININNLDGPWNLTHIEFGLLFDGSIIKAINVTEGPFLSKFGNTTFTYNISDNSVNVNITLKEPTESPHGSGTLATITFNATSRPPATTPLTLTKITMLDTEGQKILYTIGHGYYEMHEYIIHTITVDTMTFYVTTKSNSSISPVSLSIKHRYLKFNMTGKDGTIGFINITIPNEMLWTEDGWLVFVGGQQVEVIATAINATHTMLSFHATLSTKTVYIIGTGVIPEYSPLILLTMLLTLMLSAVAVILYPKRKRL